MKKVILSVAALTAIFATTSQANAGFYAGLNVPTYTHGSDGMGDGYGVGINIGYDFPLFIPLAIEAEYTYNSFKDINESITSIAANGYFFIPFPIVSPYIGYGFGNSSGKSGDSETLNQFIAGVKFKIPVLPLAISAEYRLMMIDKQDISQALLGVKYIF